MWLLQTSVQIDLTQVPSVGQDVSSSLVMFIFLIIFGIFVLFIAWLILKKILTRMYGWSAIFKRVYLLVTVPKDKDNKEEGQKEMQDILAVAEALYSTLGGLAPAVNFQSRILGRQDHFSFEIVADREGLISFYVVVPKYLQQFFEQQIHAQYHNAQIEEVDDYNIFHEKGQVAGAYLKLTKNSIFPLKTYTQTGADPLNALTNVMSKFDPSDGAVIQIVARSAHKSWHQLGAKLASKIQQGKSLKQAKKEVMGNPILRTVGDLSDYLWPQKKEDKMQDPKKEYRLSPMEEETVKALENKTSKAGFDVNIRVIVSSSTLEKAKADLHNILDSFSQYTGYEYGNGFKAINVSGKNLDQIVEDYIYRNFNEKNKMILNTEEMTSLYHFPLPTTETPNIRWLLATKCPPPANLPNEGLILGESVYRGQKKLIKLQEADRRRHLYIIGMTGVGKSVFISNLAIQDIQNGKGVCVIDPHGDLIEDILPHIPKERIEDVIVFNPSDIERPIGLNMLEGKTEEERDFATQEMIAIFYKLFPPEMIGPMFEHNMRNVMLTLMSDEQQPGTIAEIPRMFSDNDFQKQWVAKVKDPVVRSFWEKEMAKTSDFHKSEMLGYLISKVGRFVENAMIRNIIGQSHSGFNLKDVMDQQKILLVNLSKGTTGEVNSNLLGLIIVSKLQMAALARANISESERKDFYLYIDEFQNFITDSIATILAEARKYRLNLTIAHQYIGQLVQNQDAKIRDAVFGNVGTIVNFRIGVDDAETMAKQLAPVCSENDVINLERYNAYVRLLIDNQASRAFNMHCFPPPSDGNVKIAQAIKDLSRLKYGRDRQTVEREILERSQLGGSSAQQGPLVAERTL
ncbi:MAG: type IV secretion system DNA-binding domain-containing protein [Patescibacteria group bacterium]|nr:type IV secretion system DNA-binding domain-containing protein [Patescibacteria group bacterium]